jgi:hypothetical protein
MRRQPRLPLTLIASRGVVERVLSSTQRDLVAGERTGK